MPGSGNEVALLERTGALQTLSDHPTPLRSIPGPEAHLIQRNIMRLHVVCLLGAQLARPVSLMHRPMTTARIATCGNERTRRRGRSKLTQLNRSVPRTFRPYQQLHRENLFIDFVVHQVCLHTGSANVAHSWIHFA